MPLKKHIKKILIIGSGPIVIGSAAEFDYSGTQAIMSLKEEGYTVILVNPNPATIMTDRDIADKIYMEPLSERFVTYIIASERPDALLPSMGGQTALNLAVQLDKSGVLKKYNVEVLGTPISSIIGAEDRQIFKDQMIKIGIPILNSKVVSNVADGSDFALSLGFPIIIRPSYTMGGGGGGIAANNKELKEILTRGLRMSPVNEALVEKSIAGFKEVEYEVMRDANDTAIVVCNMENIDPVGVHTGDSMVVAPSLTITNKQYQMLRDASLKIVRHFNIEGGCNVQFALHPATNEYYVIEINPRVSRSSALASKATGYPIAKIAAKIAVGLRLDEIINPITKKTFAAFEPSIDYIVTKLPRFPFDKFRSNEATIGTHMQATGETMSIGRGFEESFIKSIKSLSGEYDFVYAKKYESLSLQELLKEMATPNAYRLWQIFSAFNKKATIEQIHKTTTIDKFFLNKLYSIHLMTNELKGNKMDVSVLHRAKKFGFSDSQIAKLWELATDEVRKLRKDHNLHPVYKMIDTVAGEFASRTNYLYSTYNGTDNESKVSKKPKIIIVGSGPIRIGQGVEFDYSTVHSILSFKALGYETIVINNNPETVSTDFSIADKLYFEPITTEDVMEIFEYEKADGIVLQFGGQTAINIAGELHQQGVKIFGTSFDSIDLAEDRQRFGVLVEKLGLNQPKSASTNILADIPKLAKQIGYPIMIRPSYVIGGKGMQIITNEKDLMGYIKLNILDYEKNMVLIDKYIPGKEIEVDAIFDGKDIFIPGIMEHIEKSGIHSGDSTSIFPAISLKEEMKKQIVKATKTLALGLKIVGLMNIQFIVFDNKLYVLEVNPRSSRTIPFISKATNINVIDIAVKAVNGISLKAQNRVGLNPEAQYENFYVKAPVFSHHKLHKVTDIALGPEMKSTGESMGVDKDLDKAFYKALLGADFDPLKHSKVLITVKDEDKPDALEIVKQLQKVDIQVFATFKTHEYLKAHGVKTILVGSKVEKINSIAAFMKTNKLSYLINTPSNAVESMKDAKNIRIMALQVGTIAITSMELAKQIANLTEKMRFLIKPLF